MRVPASGLEGLWKRAAVSRALLAEDPAVHTHFVSYSRTGEHGKHLQQRWGIPS